MLFHRPGSDCVAVDHVTMKDDSIGRYAEQLLGHARHHTGTMFLVLSQPELTDLLLTGNLSLLF